MADLAPLNDVKSTEWGEREPGVPAIAVEEAPTHPTRPWPTWAQPFLDLFAQTGNVMLSARGAGVERRTPYDLKGRDERFALAWAEADEASIQVLEAEARRRAMGTSDRLLEFLLKARRPATYRENHRVEVVGDGGGPIRTEVVPEGLSDHERQALRRAIDAELERRGQEVSG